MSHGTSRETCLIKLLVVCIALTVLQKISLHRSAVQTKTANKTRGRQKLDGGFKSVTRRDEDVVHRVEEGVMLQEEDDKREDAPVGNEHLFSQYASPQESKQEYSGDSSDVACLLDGLWHGPNPTLSLSTNNQQEEERGQNVDSETLITVELKTITDATPLDEAQTKSLEKPWLYEDAPWSLYSDVSLVELPGTVIGCGGSTHKPQQQPQEQLPQEQPSSSEYTEEQKPQRRRTNIVSSSCLLVPPSSSSYRGCEPLVVDGVMQCVWKDGHAQAEYYCQLWDACGGFVCVASPSSSNSENTNENNYDKDNDNMHTQTETWCMARSNQDAFFHTNRVDNDATAHRVTSYIKVGYNEQDPRQHVFRYETPPTSNPFSRTGFADKAKTRRTALPESMHHVIAARCASPGCTWRDALGTWWKDGTIRLKTNVGGILKGIVHPLEADQGTCNTIAWEDVDLQDASMTWRKLNNAISKVHLVFMAHLDVGYTTMTIDDILKQYAQTHFPRAFNTSRVLRERGGEEQFIWTSHAWLLETLLQDEANQVTTPQFRQELQKAMADGDVTWHANPMNVQEEAAEVQHMVHARGMAERLDGWFGKPKKRAASQKDTPGTTLGMIRLMKKAGVDMLHVGVNDFSTVPAFPTRSAPHEGYCNAGWWRDTTLAQQQEQQQEQTLSDDDEHEEDLLLLYCSGYSYSFAVKKEVPVMMTVLPHFDQALVFLMHVDNSGPQSAEQVLEGWGITQKLFPRAKLETSSMDAWFQALKEAEAVQRRLQEAEPQQQLWQKARMQQSREEQLEHQEQQHQQQDLEHLQQQVNQAQAPPPSLPPLSSFSSLPTVANVEYGDTWIYGIASDPTKMRWYRAVTRTMTSILQNEPSLASRADVEKFYRILLKVPEHTWGYTGAGCHDGGYSNVEWINATFKCRYPTSELYKEARGSWVDQRNYIHKAIAELEDDQLQERLRHTMKERDPEPLPNAEFGLDVEGYQALDVTQDLKLHLGGEALGVDVANGNMTMATRRTASALVKFNASAAMIHVVVGDTTFCSSDTTDDDQSGMQGFLGQLVYRTNSEAELNEFGNAYALDRCATTCGRCSFSKCGLDESGGMSSWNLPRITDSKYKRVNDTFHEFWFNTTFVHNETMSWLETDFGAPRFVIIKVGVDSSMLTTSGLDEKPMLILHHDVTWYHKRPTRMAESIWWAYAPRTAMGDHGWTMNKLGMWIDPLQVGHNGSSTVHGIWEGIRLQQQQRYDEVNAEENVVVHVASPDAPLVHPNLDLIPTGKFNAQPKPGTEGWAFNLFNNAWDTNYPLWSLEDAERFQFTVTLRGEHGKEEKRLASL